MTGRGNQVFEFRKSEPFIIVEILEYVPQASVIKTIIRKTTSNVNAVSFDSGETFMEKTSPFDTFIQIIDGKADVVIDGKSNVLKKGQSIVIPAYVNHSVNADEKFKMLCTIIKNEFES